MVYVYLPTFVSIGLFCRPLAEKKNQFLPFFGLRHLVVSLFGSSLRKLKTGAQLQTFPYPKASKSFLYPQRLHGEIKRTNSEVQKRDGQTDKQTNRQKKLNVLAAPAAGEI